MRGVLASPRGVALLPLVLMFLGLLLAWGWRLLGWPLAPGKLPPPQLLVAAILVGGALVGLRQRLPPWSYAWLALALSNLRLVGVGVLVAVFFGDGRRLFVGGEAFSQATTALTVASVFLALMVAVVLTSRGVRDALFFFALFLATKLVSFPLLLEGSSEEAALRAGLTGGLALLAALEGLALGWLLTLFLASSRAGRWWPLWALLALLVVDVPLKFWYFFLQPDLVGSRPLHSFTNLVFSTWLYDAGFFLITLVVVLLYTALRPRKA
ncbi:MAG: hypothetical protein HY686_01120 [Chloroflexi bacterium]|nr:hypothetical protein [Chloroflexota bacterium]